MAVAAAGFGAALWLTACSTPASRSSLAETGPPGTAHRLSAAVPAPPATGTSVAPTTTTTIPPLLVDPGGGRRLFPGHRVVAFYGAAGDPALGVLGDAPPQQLWSRLAAQADRYFQPGVQVVPTYELVTYMAHAAPGRHSQAHNRDGTPDADADDRREDGTEERVPMTLTAVELHLGDTFAAQGDHPGYEVVSTVAAQGRVQVADATGEIRTYRDDTVHVAR